MNRIGTRFNKLKEKGEKALVLYITAGDPSPAETLRIIPVLESAGADILEIGVPFSDPTADGPTIQAASQRALQQGATLSRILELVARLRHHSEIPVVLFSYYNPIWKFGPERFARESRAAGVDGVLVVDLPPEEAGELRRFSDPAGLDFISLLAPNTPMERVEVIAGQSRGFLYYISVIGITGTTGPQVNVLQRRVDRIRKVTDLPLVVGFGLTDPDQVRSVATTADGVVVGSALVRMIHEHTGQKNRMDHLRLYVSSLKKALNNSGG